MFRHVQNNNTVVVEVGELRVEVSRFPWQLSVYDNVTGDLILRDPWNYAPVSWHIAFMVVIQY